MKNPLKPSTNREIINLVVKNFGAKDFKATPVAYDGKSNLYTTKALPFTERNFEVTMEVEGRNKTFTITIVSIKTV